MASVTVDRLDRRARVSDEMETMHKARKGENGRRKKGTQENHLRIEESISRMLLGRSLGAV